MVKGPRRKVHQIHCLTKHSENKQEAMKQRSMWLRANLIKNSRLKMESKRWREDKILKYCYSCLCDSWAQLLLFLLGTEVWSSKDPSLAAYLRCTRQFSILIYRYFIP